MFSNGAYRKISASCWHHGDVTWLLNIKAHKSNVRSHWSSMLIQRDGPGCRYGVFFVVSNISAKHHYRNWLYNLSCGPCSGWGWNLSILNLPGTPQHCSKLTALLEACRVRWHRWYSCFLHAFSSTCTLCPVYPIVLISISFFSVIVLRFYRSPGAPVLQHCWLDGAEAEFNDSDLSKMFFTQIKYVMSPNSKLSRQFIRFLHAMLVNIFASRREKVWYNQFSDRGNSTTSLH